MAKAKKSAKASATTRSAAKANEADKEVLKQLEALLEEESTTLDTLYILSDTDRKVTLEVKVEGEGQTSDMTVRLGSELIAEKHAGDLPERSLGNGNQLAGKKLSLAAVITDTSRTTNFTGLTIRLQGGAIPVEFPLFKTVDEEGQTAEYLCLIEFFKP